jgi:signal transduction histidine kinase/ActR/RegA family two-component response regulator
MSVRTRLTRLVLVTFLLGAAAASLSALFVYREERLAREQSLAQSAQTVAQLVDNELLKSAEILRVLAASPDLQQGDLATFHEHARRIAGAENAIVLSNLEGVQVLNTRRKFGAPLPGVNPALAAQRKTRSGEAPFASNLFIGSVSGHPEIAVTVPVYVHGKLSYFLGRSLLATQMAPLLRSQNLPEEWRLSVVDRRGVVVTRSKGHDEYVGRAASPVLVKKMQAANFGTNLGTTLDGIDVLALFHRSPWSGWSVILSVPLAELQAPARDAALLLGALVAVLLVGALFIAQRESRAIAGPISDLNDAAIRLGKGEMVERRVVGLAEIDAVRDAIANAAERVAHDQAELEKRVADAIASTEHAQRALQHSLKLEALGRLTGGVAHDFNNVLQTLGSAMDVMRHDSDPQRQARYLDMCDRAIARASALVGQLRAFGQVQDAVLRQVDVGHALDAALPLLRNAATGRAEVVARYAHGLGCVFVDPVQLDMALLNLVINARDAVADGGTIELFAERIPVRPGEGGAGSERVCISVRDNGTGMSPEVSERAVEPFFTTKDSGTGLGLAQVFGFVRQADGSLEIDSKPGEGTTVSLYLPLRRVVHEPVAPRHSDVVPAMSAGQPVLLADDDELVRTMTKSMLEHMGYTVLAAASAEQAIDLLERGARVGLLFTDIVMPGRLNGLGLARLVQQRWPDVRIVLATGYAHERLDLEGVEVLAKPYQVEQVIGALERAYRSGQDTGQPGITAHAARTPP